MRKQRTADVTYAGPNNSSVPLVVESREKPWWA